VALKSIQNKPYNKRTQAEWSIEERLSKKQWDCEEKAKFELRKDAWQGWRKETLKNIAEMCAARKNSLPGELATALSASVPNKQSARDALNLAQTAALCGDYGARENAIRLLATHGDSRAQRILGNLFTFGGSTIAKDHVEGMAWYGRAGAQGDLFAQKYYRDLSAAVTTSNHVWTSQEFYEAGLWEERICSALC